MDIILVIQGIHYKEKITQWFVYTCMLSCSVTQSCLTLCNSMDYSPLGSSVHRSFQARILEWVAIPFSRGSSWPRDQTRVSCIAGRFFTTWATGEAKSTTLHCQLSSVTQLCLTHRDPMECSTPGLPVHLQLLEFTQTDVREVCDVIQPSHSMLSSSLPTFNLS